MTQIATLMRDTFYAAITQTEAGYVLYWNDHVINEWEETFDDLPTALMRLANLDHVVTNTESQGWTKQQQEFVTAAKVFLDDNADWTVLSPVGK